MGRRFALAAGMAAVGATAVMKTEEAGTATDKPYGTIQFRTGYNDLSKKKSTDEKAEKSALPSQIEAWYTLLWETNRGTFVWSCGFLRQIKFLQEKVIAENNDREPADKMTGAKLELAIDKKISDFINEKDIKWFNGAVDMRVLGKPSPEEKSKLFFQGEVFPAHYQKKTGKYPEKLPYFTKSNNHNPYPLMFDMDECPAEVYSYEHLSKKPLKGMWSEDGVWVTELEGEKVVSYFLPPMLIRGYQEGTPSLPAEFLELESPTSGADDRVLISSEVFLAAVEPPEESGAAAAVAPTEGAMEEVSWHSHLPQVVFPIRKYWSMEAYEQHLEAEVKHAVTKRIATTNFRVKEGSSPQLESYVQNILKLTKPVGETNEVALTEHKLDSCVDYVVKMNKLFAKSENENSSTTPASPSKADKSPAPKTGSADEKADASGDSKAADTTESATEEAAETSGEKTPDENGSGLLVVLGLVGLVVVVAAVVVALMCCVGGDAAGEESDL